MTTADLITCQFGRDSTAAEVVAGIDGVAAYALDPDSARRLWEVSLDAVR